MTTRNRIIYQSEALFASPVSGNSVGTVNSGTVTHLQRVTDISNNAEITRQNISVFGRLASISREIIEEPKVSLEASYYLADGFNESGIGLTTYKSAGNVSVNCLSGILANDNSAKKNLYVLVAQEGMDAYGVNAQAAGNSGQLGIIAIGNAFLSQYSVEGSVGKPATAKISFDASNISYELSSPVGFQNPAINVVEAIPTQFTGLVTLPIADSGNLSVKVLKPGDIILDFGTSSLDMGGAVLPGMTSASTKQSAHIQSFSLELPLSRTPQNRLGNAFSFSKELDVPIDVTLSVEANMADIDRGSLVDLICSSSAERDISIKLYGPCAAGDENELSLVYTLKGATIDSENFTSSIGDPKKVSLKFMAQVGGPNDTVKGLFISGRHGG
jgi:hypothetical protein